MQRIFRILATATAFTVASAVTVLAADMATMVYKAPPPAPVLPSWTGFYVGGHIGAAWQNLSSGGIQDPNGFLASGNLPGGSETAAIGGLQAGYNWQFAPSWVAGFEGDFSWTSLHDHREARPILTRSGIPAGPNAIVALDINTRWLASARARLGYTGWSNNTMFYVTGGAAWADTEYTALFQTSPPLNQATLATRPSRADGWPGPELSGWPPPTSWFGPSTCTTGFIAPTV
jgi:outer membrane immunogenic protein